MIVTVVLVTAVVALLVAALERREGRRTELAFRAHLAAELEGARIRVAQVEFMLDQARSGQLELDPPAARDGHLIVSAPAMRSAGSTPAAAAGVVGSTELSIDTLPEPLKSEIRAIEGDEVQREYLETAQRELAAGAPAAEIHARLFGED